MGTESFGYIVMDDRGGFSFEAIVTLTVDTPNQTPVISNAINDITLNVDPPGMCTFNLDTHFSDPDGDALTYSHTLPDNAVVSLSGSVLTITASGGAPSTVTVLATDPGGLFVSNSFSVTTMFGSTDCGGNSMAQ